MRIARLMRQRRGADYGPPFSALPLWCRPRAAPRVRSGSFLGARACRAHVHLPQPLQTGLDPEHASIAAAPRRRRQPRALCSRQLLRGSLHLVRLPLIALMPGRTGGTNPPRHTGQARGPGKPVHAHVAGRAWCTVGAGIALASGLANSTPLALGALRAGRSRRPDAPGRPLRPCVCVCVCVCVDHKS